MKQPKKFTKDIIEKIKNGLIVVLFFSTILLLYFFWEDVSWEKFISMDETQEHKVYSIGEILVPKEIIISAGTDSYSVLGIEKPDFWSNSTTKADSFIDILTAVSEKGNILTEEITEAQYNQVMYNASTRAVFGYNIPFSEFCDAFSIKKSQGYDNISNITEIGFSAINLESVFIRDGSKNKYYRLVGAAPIKELEGLKNKIGESGEMMYYYPLSTYFGGLVDNSTLIPMYAEVDIKPIHYTQDVSIEQKDEISAIAQSFFGESFDFVRKIEEIDGTTIFMYGYGKKILIANTDGSCEYKEEPKGVSGTNSFNQSLSMALQFIAEHGAFETNGGYSHLPVLWDAVATEDKKDGKGFRFTFTVNISGENLYYEAGAPIIIEVVENQVTYFKRDIINLDQEVVADNNQGEKEAYSAINVLAQNYEYILTVLRKKQPELVNSMGEANLENTMSLIDELKMGYVRLNSSESAGILKPAWIVDIGETRIYFDLYGEAEPLNGGK